MRAFKTHTHKIRLIEHDWLNVRFYPSSDQQAGIPKSTLSAKLGSTGATVAVGREGVDTARHFIVKCTMVTPPEA